MNPYTITLYLGVKGSGKTYLALRHLRSRPRVLIHDPNSNATMPGAAIARTPAELVRAVKPRGRFTVIWRGYETMGRAAFEWGNRVAWAAENLTVVWEEAHNYMTAQRPDGTAFRMLTANRHRRLTLMACAQRYSEVPRGLTNNADRIIVFRTVEPLDVRRLGERLGPASARLPDLPRWHALDYRPGGGAEEKKSPFK